MPNKGTHAAVGVMAGVSAAAYLSRRETDGLARALQLVGGAVGGYHGGVLPDVLEPAITPMHRSIGHSLTLGAGGAVAMVRKGEVPLQWARERVMALENELATTTDPWMRLVLTLAIALCHLAVGYGVGLAAGYASHLALDALTPSSLPLFG